MPRPEPPLTSGSPWVRPALSDVARESANVALMADDLTRPPVAIDLAHRTPAITRQNIALLRATVAILIARAVAGQLCLTAR